MRYTDRDGRVRVYDYDSAGDVVEETWYATDADADLEQNPLNTIYYTYDAAGNMLSETDDTSSIVYTYNEAGLVTSVAESSDLLPTVVYAYAYNEADLVSSVTVTIGGVSDYVDEYSYDSAGQLIEISRHGATGGNAVAEIDVTLSYNELGQVSSISRYEDDELVVTADYVYDEDGLLVGLIYHQGDTILAQYAFSGVAVYAAATISPLLPGEGQGVRAGISMLPTHTTTGIEEALTEGSSIGLLLTTMTSADGTVTYTYDALGQLLAADYTNESLADESYTYDAAGNRVTANGDSYTTGTDNQLLSDGTYTYEYDNEGNRTLRYIDVDESGTLTTNDTNITKYEWDARNRLVEVSNYTTYTTFTAETPSRVVHYFYDVENRLIAEQIDTNGDAEIDKTIGYAYDGDQITLQFEKDGEGQLAAADLSHRYLWQANAVDQLMADEQVHYDSQQEEFVTDELLYALTDHLGTGRDLAAYDDATGITSIANHRVYDSYGNLKSETNAAVDCLFGFTGRLFDELTNQQYNTTRWYDPKVGRWESEDWIGFLGGQSNLNAYCGNSPTNATDPSGLERESWTSLGGWNPWSWWGVRMIPNLLTGNSDCFGWRDAELDRKILENQIKDVKSAEDLMRIQRQQFKSAAGMAAQKYNDAVQFTAVVAGAGLVRPSLAASLKGPSGVLSTRKFLENSWDKASFGSALKSVEYHLAKHGGRMTAVEYTQQAIQLFAEKTAIRNTVIDNLGRQAIKVEGAAGKGLFTPQGKVIWFAPK